MINVENKKPNERLSKYVRKISIFTSKENIKFKHKLTTSAFTYLSYNHERIPLSILGSKKVRPVQRLVVAGPKIHENIYVEYDGKLKQILIEFTASGFYYLFHISPSSLLNSLYPLDDFSNVETNRKLELKLKNISNTEKQIKILEEFLLRKVELVLPANKYVDKSLELIEENNGNIYIKNVAELINISEKQLERKFREVVGIKPKQYSKIVQLHYVINLMNLKNYSMFQDIAFFADYYDLSHFSNRFKELTGFSPTEFINSNKHIASKYFTDLITPKQNT
ncbi:MAG TPA: AraC family transcriptional regulator [Ignavibacteriaceae bacterium]|nr:AraC family transcriptional regulator [Ignavibacteriaceae bacterium]